MVELTFQAVEQVVCIYQRVVDIHGFVQRTGEKFVEAQDHFAPQVFFVHNPDVVFDVCGTCHFTAQLGDTIRTARFFELSAV